MKRYSLFVMVLIAGCSQGSSVGSDGSVDTINTASYLPPGTVELKSSPQRSGDAERGYDYLVNGDYNARGLPLELVSLVSQFASTKNELGRTGDNAMLAPEFTAVTSPNGARVVVPNCLTCHGQRLNGQYIVGLGNSLANFAVSYASEAELAGPVIEDVYGENSKEWESYKDFERAVFAVSPYILTKVRGVNPADRLALVLALHRDPQTMEWVESPLAPLPEPYLIPTDVPAWWLLKKKHAMFYVALGRGDFARISMASGLLTMKDANEAATIDSHFPDVIAYITSIQPPKFPQTIDTTLAETGKTVFAEHCQRCHGTYGPDGKYPNLVIPVEYVKTDPELVKVYEAQNSVVNFYNQSWFSKGDHAGKLKAEKGYVAPPLDGVWATAPYLHNGSVPTLAELLDSSTRPKFFRRSFKDDDYDFVKVGWNYTLEAIGSDITVYDTTLKGYGNQGHEFGDDLSDDERNAVIEYLKTL